MAKTSTKSKSKPRASRRDKGLSSNLRSNPFASSPSTPTALDLHSLTKEALSLLHTDSNPHQALELVLKVLTIKPDHLPALDLAGQIYVELGSIPLAKSAFEKASSLDPTGNLESDGGTGPEKFLWLAQLCDEGGEVAVNWYEKGVGILRRLMQEMEELTTANCDKKRIQELRERGLKEKFASALCGLAEIYMTDLCMEPSAEEKCEKFLTEALLFVPDSAEALQTMASVRISQMRYEDAKAVLKRSFEIWKDLDPGEDGNSNNTKIPSYASRITLSRLLIEVESYEEAIDVLERLQMENDQVVDLWYLGGWCLYLMGERLKKEVEAGVGEAKEKGQKGDEINEGNDETTWKSFWSAGRDWLRNCEQLYKVLEWEDEPLREHAIEILSNLEAGLGDVIEGDNEDEEGEDEGDEEWEDEDEDEEMRDS